MAAGNLPDETADGVRIARFAIFELDLRAVELRRDGVRLKLQEQPFRLLAFLLQRPGEIVTREELRTHLWPSEFVDFDHSLNTAIRKLRTALDDSADTPRFVETLPRRGYRFIAPVRWVGGPDTREQTHSPSSSSAGEGIVLRRVRVLPMVIAMIAIAVVAAALVRPHVRPASAARTAVPSAQHPSPAIDAMTTLPFPAAPRGRPLTTSAEAYQLYLEGSYVWNKRTKADVEKAIDSFTRAARIDPQFAEAHAGVARAWGVLVGNGMVSSAIGAPRVLTAAQKALELDPANASAYVSLASTKFRNIWDFEGAERDYRRAIELNPNDATAHQWFSEFLRAMGRREEARREIDLAYALDPLSPAVNSTRCWSFYSDRRYADAIAFSRRAAQVDPRFASPQCRVNSMMAMGDVKGAVAEMQPFAADNPSVRAIVEGYRRGGVDGMLRAKLAILKSNPDARLGSSLEIADTLVLLGDSAGAFKWLEIASEQRVPRVTSFHTRPALDAIRDDPRFEALARKIGIPQAALEDEREAARHAHRPA